MTTISNRRIRRRGRTATTVTTTTIMKKRKRKRRRKYVDKGKEENAVAMVRGKNIANHVNTICHHDRRLISGSLWLATALSSAY